MAEPEEKLCRLVEISNVMQCSWYVTAVFNSIWKCLNYVNVGLMNVRLDHAPFEKINCLNLVLGSQMPAYERCGRSVVPRMNSGALGMWSIEVCAWGIELGCERV